MKSKISKYFKRLFIFGIVTTIALVLVPGCSRPDDHAGTEENYITVKGSDTMVHLVSSWAEDFMKRDPNIEVSVTGGGSGTGIAALINLTTDICAASRKIKNDEEMLAVQKDIHPKEIIVASDGIAVVVNPENPISELTIEQLGKIFTGEYTRWSEMGGSDKQIVVLSRESSSGTYSFFQEMVLKKQDYTTKAKLLPATSAIIQSASSDKLAIGYVGLGYALAAKDKVKIISVKIDDKSSSVMPSGQTVKSGQYPISRPLYLYLNSEKEEKVKKFIDFCLSDEGQLIVTETGYVAIK